MHLPHLKISDFNNWKSYYFNYQKTLAESYYIPLLKSNDININANSKVLDVGCGDGGFLTAFSNISKKCDGIEIKEFNWNEKKSPQFIIGDITSKSIKNKLKNKYDILILRDVIEHIKLENKLNFINSIKNYMNDNSRLLITFPPFYSPFGLHQQAFLKLPLKVIPFLGWLPKFIIKSLLYISNQKNKWSDLEEIKDSKMTIRNFKKLIESSDLEICNSERYFIRPSHEIRYGIKTKFANWMRIPIIEEMVISGCTFILKQKS
ncbi:MAG: class I SAM-dependent methyltransferase [Candidatus Marinimicrobia bacterium]|nr:class I SAM-dependent methyltransferase [Candidatus Neomarinimicrobiota bacterium]